jgi:hypothetical protein
MSWRSSLFLTMRVARPLHRSGRPVKLVNDAAMQALDSCNGGKMLFLGLGTGLGSSLTVGGTVEPMELGHLPYKKLLSSKTISACADCSIMERASGGASPTQLPSSSPLFNLRKWFLAAATSRNWANFLLYAAQAATPTRLSEDSGFGKRRVEWKQSKTQALVGQ